MAKLCFVIVALTLVTVVYGSLPGAKKFVVPIRETRPFEFPACVPRPCTLETEQVDCYEVGCYCDDVSHICREKRCSDTVCETDMDCPFECGECDENFACEELPPPQPSDTTSESDYTSSDGDDTASDDDKDGSYGNDGVNDRHFSDGSDGSYYGEEK